MIHYKEDLYGTKVGLTILYGNRYIVYFDYNNPWKENKRWDVVKESIAHYLNKERREKALKRYGEMCV